VTNQGDMFMEKLRNLGILKKGEAKPRNLIKRLVFLSVRGVNHFVSSGMRVYAVK
jgi:hypothetical protein